MGESRAWPWEEGQGKTVRVDWAVAWLRVDAEGPWSPPLGGGAVREAWQGTGAQGLAREPWLCVRSLPGQLTLPPRLVGLRRRELSRPRQRCPELAGRGVAHPFQIRQVLRWCVTGRVSASAALLGTEVTLQGSRDLEAWKCFGHGKFICHPSASFMDDSAGGDFFKGGKTAQHRDQGKKPSGYPSRCLPRDPGSRCSWHAGWRWPVCGQQARHRCFVPFYCVRADPRDPLPSPELWCRLSLPREGGGGCCHQPPPVLCSSSSLGNTERVTQWLIKAGGRHVSLSAGGRWRWGFGLRTGVLLMVLSVFKERMYQTFR